MTRWPVVLLIVTALAASAASARAGLVPADWTEPAPDTAFTREVKQWTTDARFFCDIAGQLPLSANVPSPRAFLGYTVGAPGKLTYYQEIRGYFDRLAATSPRIVVRSMGRTNEGREMIVVLIASEKIMAHIDDYADITAKLSDPRVTPRARAAQLASSGRVFYYLTGGLHSPESGSPEMLMELAYRLVAGESPMVRRIRNNLITMITPVLEPDGRQRMVDWYYNVTIDHDDWDDMPQRYPPYWGHYALHDNNRDGLQVTQPLTRNTFDTFFRYHPQVIHDLHESVPLLYVSAGTGPYNDALDPITTNEWQLLSNQETTEMTSLGMPGVWTWGFYTGWWPGYLMWLGNNHNGIGRFYETFGNAGASTFSRSLKSKFAGREVTSRQWYRPWPPDKKIKWSFRDNINYMESAALIALNYTASNRRSFLFDYWQKARNAVDRGHSRSPYAWIIPARNRTRFETCRLIESLLDQRIEVHTLDQSFRADDIEFKRGDYVVRLDQPYGRFARSLLEPQKFPEDAVHPPYDDVAWTLPLLYGVDAYRIDDAAIFDARMKRVSSPPHPAAPEPGKHRGYIVAASPSSRFLAARVRIGKHTVYAADTNFTVGRRAFPRGSWLIPAADDASGAVQKAMAAVASQDGLDVVGVRSLPGLPRRKVDLPRIAVYHTWAYTQDSGWVRYMFDRWHVPYTLINKDDVRRGGLRDLFDVILIPSTRFLSARAIVQGIDTKWSPLPYRKTTESPNIGVIDSSDDITGGMGSEGVVELEHFVDSGGTLITLGGASVLPVEMGMVRHINRVRPAGLVNPGSVVRARVLNARSPIVYGYKKFPDVFRGNLPLFSVSDPYRKYSVLQYGTAPPKKDDEEATPKSASGAARAKRKAHGSKGTEKIDTKDDPFHGKPICVSGMVKGGDKLAGKPAILVVPRGHGRIVLFSFNPMHRYLNLANAALANNAILNWNN